MNQLAPILAGRAPQLIVEAGEHAAFRFLEFFTAQIRNPHTRRAYANGIEEFCAWLIARKVPSIGAVSSVHIAAYIEELGKQRSAPTVKQRLAAIRSLFGWLATNGVLAFNPATAVRGPRHVVRKGKTAVLAPDEARILLDSIDASTPIGLRDRALIALMVYTFARIGAATAMKVSDVYVQRRRLHVRLQEKGGKVAELPCHHNLEAYLHAYLEGTGIDAEPESPLFRTIGRGTGQLTLTPLPSRNAYAMVQRRAAAAGIMTRIGNHTFRATGITAYLTNGGTLEKAAHIANHASTRTTQLYDRRSDDVNLDEIERIVILDTDPPCPSPLLSGAWWRRPTPTPSPTASGARKSSSEASATRRGGPLHDLRLCPRFRRSSEPWRRSSSRPLPGAPRCFRRRPAARGVKPGTKPKLHQQREALARREAGESCAEIGRSYNVSHSTISGLKAEMRA